MYEYTELGPGQIRLLQIQPDVQDDLLQCSLFNVPLAEAKGIFDALSWTWGSDSDPTKRLTMPVMVDGRKLDVGSNLWSMLNALRSRNFVGSIWIDAICINQDKDKAQERNKQIQMMAEIYEVAEEVAIWLGESADDSDYVLETLKVGDSEAYTTEKFVLGMLALLNRPWWTRTWIAQEFILNKRAPKILCGQAPSISAELVISVWRSDAVREAVSEIVIDKALLWNLGPVYWLFHTRQSRHNANTPYLAINLRNALMWLKPFYVTEPKDKIYGVLGLIEKADRDRFESNPGVHTEHTIPRVFADTAIYLLKYERASTIFYSFPVGRLNGLDAASWVPNFNLEVTASVDSVVRLGDVTSNHLDNEREDVTFSTGDSTHSTLGVRGRILDRSLKVITIGSGTVSTWDDQNEVIKLLAMPHILNKIRKAMLDLRAYAQGEQTFSEPLWKTLIAGDYGSIPAENDQAGCEQRFNELMAIPLTDQMYTFKVLDNLKAEPKILSMILRTLTTGRAFFTGRDGYYGLSEPGIENDDILALLFPDHFVPFILRPVEKGYEMVGVAYIPGPMLESAIAAIKADRSTLENFSIV